LIQVNPGWCGSFSMAEEQGGIAVSDFCYSGPMMQRVLQQAETMDQMMQCVGVEPVRAARIDRGMAWYEARSRCIACIDDRHCRDWIAAHEGTPQSVPPTFCRNAEFFRKAKAAIDPKLTEERHEPAPANMGTTLASRHAQLPRSKRA
jgi:uncharacterized protein DUF6455